MNKNSVIKNRYHDQSGYGSVQKTYQEARETHNSITLQNVKDWFAQNDETKKQLKGYNSFINDGAYEEFQVDLAFLKLKKN